MFDEHSRKFASLHHHRKLRSPAQIIKASLRLVAEPRSVNRDYGMNASAGSVRCLAASRKRLRITRLGENENQVATTVSPNIQAVIESKMEDVAVS